MQINTTMLTVITQHYLLWLTLQDLQEQELTTRMCRHFKLVWSWTWMDWRLRLRTGWLSNIKKWRRNRKPALPWWCTSQWMRLWCCCTFPWHHVLPTNTTLFPLQTPPSPASLLLFCLKFNKGWKSGGLKRASGVFWQSFMSHARAMWTRWHWEGRREGGVLGTGGQRERDSGKKRTKEGKFWTRETGKRQEQGGSRDKLLH